MRRKVNIDIKKAVRLYESGHSITTVADKMDVSWVTMQRRLKAAGAKMRVYTRKIRPGRKCSCCGGNIKGKNYFLCESCFRGALNEQEAYGVCNATAYCD